MELTKHGKYLTTVPSLSWWLADRLERRKARKQKSLQSKKSSAKKVENS